MKKNLLSLGNKALLSKNYEEAIRFYKEAKAKIPELVPMLDLNIQRAYRLASGIGNSNQSEFTVKVDIIVPVYNALDDVEKCLRSLETCLDNIAVRIIVVNDGSDEKTTKWLRDFCSGKKIFSLIENECNFGYTKSINAGLKLATGDYIVTQNSDTIVSPGWLTGLLACIRSKSNIGIVGPLSNAASWQSVPYLWDRQGNFTVNALPNDFSVSEMADLVKKSSIQAYPRLPFINGFCFMIKREVIEAIGYMDDENFPIGYGEENDYCIRAIDAGFELAIADDVYVYHSKSKSFGHSRRTELSKNGTENLKKKHSAKRFSNLVDKVKKTSDLDAVRLRIKQALGWNLKNETVSIRKRLPHITLDTVDMHGINVKLSPPPVYAIKDYDMDAKLTAPCLTLPFEHVNYGNSNILDDSLDIGIHLHLYYVDMLEEFIFFLGNLKQKFVLYVSIVNEEYRSAVEKKIIEAIPNVRVVVECFPNKGRDIGPFLAGFGHSLCKHELICHIHSKRSLHNPNKSDWRRQLLVNLLGSKSIVLNIINAFNDNKSIGMIYPEYHHSLNGQISWGTNFPICKNLADLLNINISDTSMKLFPAGSMFWARSAALIDLFNLNLKWDDFPSEQGQVDGTLAHAVERLFGEVVNKNSYDSIQVKSSKPYNLIFYHPHKWPFSFSRTSEQISANIEQNLLAKKSLKAKHVVYSAMTGRYENPVVHELVSELFDYVIYTDSPINNRGFWDVKPIPYEHTEPVRRARYIKTNPHKVLNKYDIAIWVDANVIIRCDLKKYLSLALDNPDVALFGISHPHRNCLYEEAKAVVNSKKDTSEKVDAQMNRYLSEGYPKKNGLIESNFLIINLQHPKARILFDAWSNEISKGSHRDQLSLNYCLWKTDTKWLPIFQEKITLRDSFDFAYLGHGKNSGYPADFVVRNDEIIAP